MPHPLLEQVKELCPNIPGHHLMNLLTTVQCISLARSTNLAKAKDHVAQVIGGSVAAQAKPQSNYTRLIRTVRSSVSEYHEESTQALHQFGRLLTSDFKQRSILKAHQLIIDGTKFEFRGDKVHFLTLCVVVEGIGLPIASLDLAKKGHSSQKERMDWFSEIGEQFNFKGMVLLGDREYVGKEWFNYLTSKKIDFVVRIKKGIYHEAVNNSPGRSQSQMCEKLRKNKKVKRVSKLIILYGQEYRYIVLRNPKSDHPKEDEFVFLLTSLKSSALASNHYRVRWQIEVTFKHLKSNGFDLEAMRVEGTDKRNLLMLMASVAFVMMAARGARFYRQFPKSRQTKMDPQRKVRTLVHSVFRTGMAQMMTILAKPLALLKYLAAKIPRQKSLPWLHV